MSHRGGRPGFVEVDAGGGRLTWPDDRGNPARAARSPRAGRVTDLEIEEVVALPGARWRFGALSKVSPPAPGG